MKLNYKLLNTAEMESTLAWVSKPVFFELFCGEVLINKEMPGIDRILDAVRASWQYDTLDCGEPLETVEKAYSTIKEIAGDTAANQFCGVWGAAAELSRKEKYEKAAEKWIDEVYERMEVEDWDKLDDLGLDGQFLSAIHAVFHKRYINGDDRYEHSLDMWKKAIFVYAFNLGREAERKAVT